LRERRDAALLPILLQIVIAFGFAGAALITSVALGKTGRRTATKDSAYECGMLPIGEAQAAFSV
jgi:NADH-quinone oxidoreductase subunit A